MEKSYSASYAAAGVDITAGYRSVELMKQYVARTMTENCIGGLGGFGGLFELDCSGMEHPVLISGTDGVGTKLRVAQYMNKHDTIGIDCVAMCVNDVICAGAKPLVFLDYIACGKNIPEKIAEIVKGVAEGCVQAGCSLVGGETAEHPGMMPEEEYDLAGFTVGVVDKSKILDNSTMQPGDVVLALPSTGVHSNGFSLVRKIFDIDNHPEVLDKTFEGMDKTLGEALLAPTKIYVKPVLALMEQVTVKGVSHITGGGFYENIPRSLKKGCAARIAKADVRTPALFGVLAKEAMCRSATCSTPSTYSEIARSWWLPGTPTRRWRFCTPTARKVPTVWAPSWKATGWNWYEACSCTGIRRRHQSAGPAGERSPGENPNGKIVLVVASKPGVYALERAANFGVESAVVARKEYADSEAFDSALLDTLQSHQIDVVVLAGFLSVLGPRVIEAYPNRILNVHPSLIPSFCGPGFYGLRVHEAALARGVKVTGATVHLVNEECDGGPILLQKAVAVQPGDTPEVLQKRVMVEAEWKLLPQALAMVCNDEV